jgi:tetratricopeptide (TPR) repeat protein
MTRIVTTAAVILLLTLFVGCEANTGTSQKLPNRSAAYASEPNQPLAVATSADEIDLVEKMASLRQDYRRSLQALIQYYDAFGNHEKVTWAREELRALDRIPQYQYIIEAQVMPATLRATERIAAADQLYQDAEKLYKDAGVLPLTQLKDVQLLRAALRKYGELISRYPTSDKIDDAAYRMGHIHEGLGDYTIALSFYERAYQWDPATPYPARFKAADILDKKLHNRAKALEVYQEAIVKEARYTDLRLMAERRVQELNTSKDAPTPPK